MATTQTSNSPAKKAAAKKSTAKKSTAKKTSAQKTSAQKSTAKKSTAKKTSAKKTSAGERSPGGDAEEQAPRKKVPAMKVARAAAQQLTELTGRQPECVVGVQRTDDGWQVDLEVVESRRIPDSTDILAIYRVESDQDGDLTGYQRLRRYVRGKSGDGDGGGR